MSRLRAALSPVRLASPMAQHPLAFLVLGLIACLLGGIGFARYGIDAGTELLVGSRSDAGQTYARFTSAYGSDPIVVVVHAAPEHPASFYLETNVLRLVRLEGDMQSDPNVQSVLGPGAVITAAQSAVEHEIQNVSNGFYGFTETTYILELLAQKGQTSPGTFDLSKLSQQDLQNAQKFATDEQTALLGTIGLATKMAEDARTAYDKLPHPGTARIIDDRERAADAAAGTVKLPPLFTEYVASSVSLTPAQLTVAQAKAHLVIDEFAAAYGQCSSLIQSTLLGSSSVSCADFILRLFLDLPNCPRASQTGVFCSPKRQWSALLPVHDPGADSYEIITVRMKPDAARSRDAVDEVTRRLRSDLDSGFPNSSDALVKSLGPLLPDTNGCRTTETSQARCQGDTRLDYTIAGVPILTAALTTATSRLLLALLPLAGLVMLLLLFGIFRVRGRFWPLLAAAGASLLTVGLALALGTSITPAVLAGIPVLVGLGVDYAVQLIARLAEERQNGLGVEAALRVVLSRSGPATLVAAAATVAGLAGLLLLTGVDLRPLVAVPLVAQFSLVLIVGVILSWLAAVLVALPGATLAERRLEARTGRRPRPEPRPAAPPARRTLLLADRWMAVVAASGALALAGWIALPHVPVETQVERLLARDLPELHDVDIVRAQTGAANELDLFLEGDVTSTNAQLYERQLALVTLCQHPGQITTATAVASILDTGAQNAATSGDPCAQPPPAPSPGASPSPAASGTPRASSPAGSAGASASPGAATPTASPTAFRGGGDGGIRHGDDGLTPPSAVLAANPGPAVGAAGTPAPSAAAATPSGSPAAPSPGATPSPGGATNPQLVLQSNYICELRLFALISHSLVDGITPPAPNGSGGTQPCPPPNIYAPGVAISADTSPATITNTRIPMGVSLTSVADQAALIDAVNHDVSSADAPPTGIGSVRVTGIAALAAAAYDSLTGVRSLFLNLVPLLVVLLVLLLVHRDQPRRALLPVVPTALAAGWGPLLILLLGRLPGDGGHILGSLTPLTVVLGALVVALATEFGVVLLSRFYEERRGGLDPEAAASAAVGAVGRAVLVSAATLGAGFAVLAFSALLPNSLPIISAFGFTVVLDLGLAVLAVFGVMLPLAVAWERVAPLIVPGAGQTASFVRLGEREAVAVGGGRRRRSPAGRVAVADADDDDDRDAGSEAVAPRRRGLAGGVARRGRRAVEEGPDEDTAPPDELDEVGDLEEADLEPVPHRRGAPAARETPARRLPGWTAEAETDGAAAAIGAAAGRTGDAAREGAGEPPARRLPGMSARRRRAEDAAPPAPGTPAGATGRSRLPGLSGRRRGAGTAAPAQPTSPAATGVTSTAPRRRPGGSVPRRAAADGPAVEAPARGPAAAPPSAPSPRVARGPSAGVPQISPPAGRPQTSPPTGSTGGAHPDPSDATPQRHRRRRPPPHVRRRDGPQGPDAPPQP